MLFTSPFAEVRTFLDEVVETPTGFGKAKAPSSKIQHNWISICMTAMVLMGKFCFARIQLASGGRFSARAFSWMLHFSKICWDTLFEKSILRLILKDAMHLKRK